MTIIDAMGLACPQPVILAKKALTEDAARPLTVLVDNEIATKNLSLLGQSLGRETSVKTLSDSRFEVLFAPQTAQKAHETAPRAPQDAYVVVLSAEEMGGGDPAFGKKLLEGFVYALTEQDNLPRAVLCYNRGVCLTTENDKTVADLKTLADKGVEVLSCGLCLDYYGLKERLQVGAVTNMYRICEMMTTLPVVRP